MAINTTNIKVIWDQDYPGGGYFVCPLCEGTDTLYRPPQDISGLAQPGLYRCWTCDFEDVE